MAEGIWDNIIKWTILILFVVLFIFILYNPAEGFMGKISKLALGVQKYLPITPQKEIRQESLPDAIVNAQKSFMGEISAFSDKEKCLFTINRLASLGNYRLALSNYEGVVSRIEKPVSKEGSIKLNPLKTENEKLEVCVIAPKAFHDCYLNPAKAYAKTGCTEQIYNDVKQVIITKNSIIINEDEVEYELSTIAFKPSKDKVCFIPLHKLGGCDAKEASIGDDCVGKMPFLITSCGGKMSGFQLCSIMQECFRAEGISPYPPLEYCSEKRTALRANTKEACEKVQKCLIKNFNLQSICSQQAIGQPYELSIVS